MTTKISGELVRNLTCALALLCASSAAAQSGTFRRWQKNLPTSRQSTSPLSLDNCTGAAQSIAGIGALTWTRATTATCTQNDGTLVTVSSGQPRCRSIGCQVEPSATNLEPRSGDFTTAAWTKATLTLTAGDPTCGLAPDGSSNAVRAVASGGDSYITQPVTITPSTVYTASVWAKKASDNAGAPAVNIYFQASGNPPSALVLGTSWARTPVTVTSGGAVTVGNLYIGGGSTFTAADGPICFWGAQVELGSVATSYIPTLATAVTRNADAASFPKPTWLRDNAGCAAATITFPTGIVATGTPARILAMGATNTLLHASSSFNAVGVTDGTNSAFFSKTILGTSSTIRSYWSGTSLAITDGSTTNVATYDRSILVGSTVSFGSAQGSSNFLYGYIANVKLGSSASGCK